MLKRVHDVESAPESHSPLLGTLVSQADTRALALYFAVTISFAVSGARRKFLRAAVLTRDALIDRLGDNPVGRDQSQKEDYRYNYVSHIATHYDSDTIHSTVYRGALARSGRETASFNRVSAGDPPH